MNLMNALKRLWRDIPRQLAVDSVSSSPTIPSPDPTQFIPNAI